MKVLELMASLGLDTSEYKKGLENAEDDATTSGSKLGSVLSSLGGKVATIASTAIVAGATMAGAVAKSAVEAYANYEQYVGGVETLFKDSADIVTANANKAFKTAGLSANEYMDTVTSFSASLISSLGGNTKKSAELADQAIIDMSDNANKMGTSMESIENAYQGFAKQNYTMLDNLKLGYGGTKEEMERLLQDAQKLTGVRFNIDNFSDVVTAIHAIQEEMGIAGTTAEEASSTISGSLNMVKSAWQNLLTGFANSDADQEANVSDLTDSIEAFANNIIPAIERALEGIGEALPALAKKLTPMLFNLITTLLPSLAEAGVELVEGLIEGLSEAIPQVIPAIIEAITTIIETLADNRDTLVEAGGELAIALVEGLIRALPQLLFDALPRILIATLKSVIIDLPQALGEVTLDAFYTLGEMEVEGFEYAVAELPNYQKSMWNRMIEVAQDSAKSLTPAMQSSANALASVLDSASQALPAQLNNLKIKFSEWATSLRNIASAQIPQTMNAIIEGLSDLPNRMSSVLTNAIVAVTNFFSNFENIARQDIQRIINTIVNYFSTLPQRLMQAGRQAIQGFINGIEERIQVVLNKVKDMIDKIKSMFTEVEGFDIHSPSRWFKWIGEMCIDGFNAGFDSLTSPEMLVDNVKDSTTAMARSVSNDTGSNSSYGGTVYNQTINVNQQVSTADELARAVRIESRYGLMRGTAIG